MEDKIKKQYFVLVGYEGQLWSIYSSVQETFVKLLTLVNTRYTDATIKIEDTKKRVGKNEYFDKDCENCTELLRKLVILCKQEAKVDEQVAETINKHLQKITECKSKYVNGEKLSKEDIKFEKSLKSRCAALRKQANALDSRYNKIEKTSQDVVSKVAQLNGLAKVITGNKNNNKEM